MPAIHPAPQDTGFDRPGSFDPGFVDFNRTMAYDALYHSPFSAVYRGTGLFLEKNWSNSRKLSPDEANELYGLGGALNFDEEIYESAAKLMHDRKVAEQRRQMLIGGGMEHGGAVRAVTGFGVSLGATLVDPINLGSMFIPVVGQSRYLSGAKAGFRGLITPRQLARVVGTNRTNYRLAMGAIEGGVGMAAVEPFILIPNLYEQSDYGLEQSMFNLGAGVFLGAGLHFGIGAASSKFKQYSKMLSDSLDLGDSPFKSYDAFSPRDAAELDYETHRVAIEKAIADLAGDEPVTSPGSLIDLDRQVVMDQLRDDILERSRQEINEYYIRQSRAGYDLLVEQYRNEGSRLGWDAEDVADEVERELGNPLYLENKIREELLAAESTPEVKISSSELNTRIESIVDEASRKILDRMGIEYDNPRITLKEQGFDNDHVLQIVVDDKGSIWTPEFLELKNHLQTALGLGHDIGKAKVEVGTDSLVLITDNSVIKISTEDLSSSHIPGITVKPEHVSKGGSMHMTISERIKPLSELKIGKRSLGGLNDIIKAFEATHIFTGRILDDLHADNIGINKHGEYLVLDLGRIFEATDDLPFEQQAKLLGELTPTQRKLYDQLQQQFYSGDRVLEPKITDEMVEAEIQRRIKNLTEKKRRQFKSEQKRLDTQPEISKARESVIMKRPIKEAPDPVEPLTKESTTEAKTQVDESLNELERKLELRLDDLAEEVGEELELDADEVKFLKEQTDTLKDIGKIKQGIKNAISCVTNKQI